MTARAEPTPAPWRAFEPGDYGDYDGRCIVVSGNNNRKRVLVVLGTNEESIANAQLVAAAHDLRVALRAMEVRFTGLIQAGRHSPGDVDLRDWCREVLVQSGDPKRA